MPILVEVYLKPNFVCMTTEIRRVFFFGLNTCKWQFQHKIEDWKKLGLDSNKSILIKAALQAQAITLTFMSPINQNVQN